jgi:hypothetical protein
MDYWFREYKTGISASGINRNTTGTGENLNKQEKVPGV